MTVNAHTHLYSGLVPLGMPAPPREPRDFSEILEAVWWRLDRAIDERSLRSAARYYLDEAKELGTTAIVDHHESPNFIEGSLDVLADACAEAGMNALLCYGATERNGGREEARRGLAECRRFILSNRRPGIRGAVGLHAAFTVSDQTIADAVELARDLAAPLHIHVAEDRVDAPGFSRLLENGALIPGSIFAHGVHLTPEQVRLCGAGGVWLVQNPRSNRANRVGYPGHLSLTPYVALGTDGFPSNLAAEAASLRASGETEREIERRMWGGEVLAEELFGADPARSARAAREASPDRPDITASTPVIPSTPHGVIPSVSEGSGREGGTTHAHPAGPPPGSLATLGMTPDDYRAEASRLWERMKCIR